jgi:2,5-diketo-D-gluconate reductase A
MYGDERGVGEAVRASGLDRADLFVTSTLNNGFHRPDHARRALDRTLADLGFDYLDLFLIHWPLPTLYDGDGAAARHCPLLVTAGGDGGRP